jgi:rhodanese-related sulfurtransferase
MICHLFTSLALLLGLSLSGCAQSGEDSLSWRAVDTLIQRDFPDVETISTDSLAAWLADSVRTQPILIDAREADEYAVSHLARAVRMNPDASGEALIAELDALLAAADSEQPVIVYCSVGYRSARMVDQLQAAGVLDVRNLEGSIFRWANEGRTVVRDGVPVLEVHPFDAAWGRLLQRDLHPE